MVENRIKQLRESRGITHEELATEIGIGYASVYRYESGKSQPSADILNRMADLFNVSVDYLLGRTSQIDAQLTERENQIIHAMRQGERIEAIKLIVEGK